MVYLVSSPPLFRVISFHLLYRSSSALFMFCNHNNTETPTPY